MSTLLSRLSSWVRHCAGGINRAPGWVPPIGGYDPEPRLSEVSPSEPPAPPPLSCFARGVVQSLREHPEEWTKVMRTPVYLPDYRHEPTGLTLSRWDDPNPIHITGVTLTSDESTAIWLAVVYMLEWHDAAKEREAAAKLAPTVAHFAALGCPDTAPTSNPSVITS